MHWKFHNDRSKSVRGFVLNNVQTTQLERDTVENLAYIYDSTDAWLEI